jgi:hypothetical protein
VSHLWATLVIAILALASIATVVAVGLIDRVFISA